MEAINMDLSVTPWVGILEGVNGWEFCISMA